MESFRNIGNLNLDGIQSIFVEQTREINMDIKNLNIDEKFTKETIESFNKRHIVPENINNLIELCNYLQITNKENF